jgi:hypothetical protein
MFGFGLRLKGGKASYVHTDEDYQGINAGQTGRMELYRDRGKNI